MNISGEYKWNEPLIVDANRFEYERVPYENHFVFLLTLHGIERNLERYWLSFRGNFNDIKID